jgi:poly-gamma-glutamate synthesis protein (capsule biosynthesis protein)
VTLANNHALDFGYEALLDTFVHLGSAGVKWVGAGADVTSARSRADLTVKGTTVAVLGVTDHPDDFAAADDRPGVAFADLRAGVPGWVGDAIREASAAADIVVVTPHWGPNMVAEPVPWVREGALALVGAGADLVTGHSAHVFHGVDDKVLFDLGDFVDDYAIDAQLRNDLGLLFFVTFDGARIQRIEALPLKLDYCYTRAADGEDLRWIENRFRSACAALEVEVSAVDGRLVIAG